MRSIIGIMRATKYKAVTPRVLAMWFHWTTSYFFATNVFESERQRALKLYQSL